MADAQREMKERQVDCGTVMGPSILKSYQWKETDQNEKLYDERGRT